MRIYISSTSVDLQEHRLATINVLRQMGHDVIGMEDYVAEGMRPLDRCLADVANADAYIGIFAWRYGSQTVAGNSESTKLPPKTRLGSTSITEFELRQAEHLAKTRILFLLDPKASWPTPYIDAMTGEGDRGECITRLRIELGLSTLVNFFTSAEDLARKVAAVVHRGEVRDRMQRLSLKIETGFVDALSLGQPVRDSTLISMQHSLVSSDSLAALRIDLRAGDYWWSTRLFLLSALAEDVTLSRLLLFVEQENKFVGATTPSTLRERLVRVFPTLRRVDSALRRLPLEGRDLARALTRRAETWERLLPQPNEEQLRVFVTTRELRRWLGDDLITKAVDRGSEEPTAAFLRAILDWPHAYVPVATEGSLEMVVNRNALADQLARMFVADLTGEFRSLLTNALPNPR